MPSTRFLRLGSLLLLLVACASDPGHRRAKDFGDHGPNCSDIEAASRISFSTDRAERLKRLAARQNLSTHEQIYLIDVSLSGGFSSDQADVLVVLASNPALTNDARAHLSRRLEDVYFSTERERIVDALLDNPSTER